MIELRLPWPPSGNHSRGYRTVLPATEKLATAFYDRGPGAAMKFLRSSLFVQVYLKKPGKDYQLEVRSIVGRREAERGPMRIDFTLLPPDRRKRDPDNVFKTVLDALEYANVVADDKQFVAGSWETGEPVAGGAVLCRITAVESPQQELAV